MKDQFFASFKHDDGSDVRSSEIYSLINTVLAIGHSTIEGLNCDSLIVCGNILTIDQISKPLIEELLSPQNKECLVIQYKIAGAEEAAIEITFNPKDRSTGTIHCVHPLASEQLADSLPHIYFERLKIGRNYFEAIREDWWMLP